MNLMFLLHEHHSASIGDSLLDALLDSLKVFAFVFLLYLVLGFIEKIVEEKIAHKSKITPLIGASVGLIPQCGVSVGFSDLFIKNKITIGCLIAVFLACSDEAMFLFISEGMFKEVCLLLISKFIYGFLIGTLVDYVFMSKGKVNDDSAKLCHHHHEHHHEHKNKFLETLKHTFFHALEVFIYVLIVNLVFAIILYFTGDALEDFLLSNEALSPLLAVLVGLIPNCASSVVLSKLYIFGSISFASLLAGLSANAGLGVIYLFKSKKNIKVCLMVVAILLVSSIAIGYLSTLFFNFYHL